MRAIVLVAAILSCSSLAGCAPAAQATETDERYVIGLMTARSAMADGEMRLVLAALHDVAPEPVYSKLSPKVQYEVAQMRAYALQSEGEPKDAHAAFVRLTKHPQATPGEWGLRMHMAVGAGDGADAMRVFRYFAEREPEFMASFSGDGMSDFDRLIGQMPDPEAAAARIELGGQLEKEDWRPGRAYQEASLVWFHYVEALLAKGDVKGASRVAARIADPTVISAMQADRRFDGVVAAQPHLQDANAAAEAYLESAQTFARAHPRWLSAQLAVLRAYGNLGREQEALAEANRLQQAIARAPRSRPPFDDMDMWWMLGEFRASALVGLGRFDEAIAIRMSKVGQVQDSWSIVRTLIAAGRGREALEWLEPLNEIDLTQDALMIKFQHEACASAQVDDTPRLEKALAGLRAGARNRPEALLEGLVCANRLDEAAEALKSLLAAPRTRFPALKSLQVYDDPPTSANEARLKERWVALRNREDVRAAALKVGRLNTYRFNGWQTVS